MLVVRENDFEAGYFANLVGYESDLYGLSYISTNDLPSPHRLAQPIHLRFVSDTLTVLAPSLS
jgi:hypothetical protein